jgi:hypothetical protein
MLVCGDAVDKSQHMTWLNEEAERNIW